MEEEVVVEEMEEVEEVDYNSQEKKVQDKMVIFPEVVVEEEGVLDNQMEMIGSMVVYYMAVEDLEEMVQEVQFKLHF
jgi:hypothetical protein